MKYSRKNIGGIWRGRTERGDEMLKIIIHIGGKAHRAIAFPNSYKVRMDQPDYRIYPHRDDAEGAVETLPENNPFPAALPDHEEVT